jgi:hypothetical protein
MEEAPRAGGSVKKHNTTPNEKADTHPSSPKANEKKTQVKNCAPEKSSAHNELDPVRRKPVAKPLPIESPKLGNKTPTSAQPPPKMPSVGGNQVLTKSTPLAGTAQKQKTTQKPNKSVPRKKETIDFSKEYAGL